MTLTARQRRILTSLALEDLLWEVPDQEYFTQYNERTGRHMRVHISILGKMAELGLIQLVKQGTHQLNYWSLTPEGQRFVVELQPLSRSPGLSHSRQPFHTTKKSA